MFCYFYSQYLNFSIDFKTNTKRITERLNIVGWTNRTCLKPEHLVILPWTELTFLEYCCFNCPRHNQYFNGKKNISKVSEWNVFHQNWKMLALLFIWKVKSWEKRTKNKCHIALWPAVKMNKKLTFTKSWHFSKLYFWNTSLIHRSSCFFKTSFWIRNMSRFKS